MMIEQIKSFLVSDSGWYLHTIIFVALILTIIIKAALKIIAHHLRKAAAKTSLTWDDIFVDILDGLKSPVIFVCLFYC